jgi:hypothetical protein
LNNEKKEWKIEFSKEALKNVDKLPDEVYDKLSEVIKGFKEGKLDPTKIGQSVSFVELYEKLKCPECNSEEVEWLLDKNSEEVTFHCLKCSESFWMTHSEYKNAIKRNPDKLIKIE